MSRHWFITGSNRGIGRAVVDAALAAGDRVVATARDPHTLADLGDRVTALPLDVRNRDDAFDAARAALDAVGHIDVVVNNAGHGLVGAVEELSEAQVRDQMDTNFFGALWVSQAFAPHLRARGRGRIVQISTVGAVGALPLFGLYNASKWALEGFSAALADELRPFGVQVTIAQLGGFDTDWAKSSMQFATALPDYTPTREAILGMPGYPSAPPPVDPEWAEPAPDVAAAELLALVDDADPPLRRIIGPGASEMVAALDQRRLDYAKDPAFVWPSAD